MNEQKWLIFRILDLLETIETKENQPRVTEIRGLLFELLDELEL